MPHEELLSPGLGTSDLAGEECVETVRLALDTGYRHLDTAQVYDNAAAIGRALDAADVPREEVFLASKVHPGNLAPGDVRESVQDSLDALGVARVDLLYVHWPMGAYAPETTLPAFDDLRQDGLTRHVGLSNFTPELLEEAQAVLESPVFAHQVECHPLLPQRELRELAAGKYHLVSYSPLARGDLLEHPVVAELAVEHGARTAQVCLAWAMEHDLHPIPKARGEHVQQNFEARSLELSADEVARLDAIEERRRVIDPRGAPWQ